MTVTQAIEGMSAVVRLAKARSVVDHSLARRLADEAEIVRLYRVATGIERDTDKTSWAESVNISGPNRGESCADSNACGFTA